MYSTFAFSLRKVLYTCSYSYIKIPSAVKLVCTYLPKINPSQAQLEYKSL